MQVINLSLFVDNHKEADNSKEYLTVFLQRSMQSSEFAILLSLVQKVPEGHQEADAAGSHSRTETVSVLYCSIPFQNIPLFQCGTVPVGVNLSINIYEEPGQIQRAS